MLKKTRQIGSVFLAALTVATAAAVELEDLGAPVKAGNFPIYGFTKDAAGATTAWTKVKSNDRIGIVGAEVDTGKATWLDIAADHPSRMILIRVYKNKVYGVQGGKPSRVIEYDPATGQRRTFKLPVNGGYFVDSSADISPDGKIYVGTFPDLEIGWFDPATGKTGSLPRVNPDENQKYILQLLVDQDNIVYFTVGLHHPEVWSYRPGTGEKKQILPEKHLTRSDRANLMVVDGTVYSWMNGEYYRCTPDRMEQVAAIPGVAAPKHRVPCNLEYAPGKELVLLDSDCRLAIRDSASGKMEYRQIDLPGFAPLVYSISRGTGNRLWIGSFSPPGLASFDPDQSEGARFVNYGRQGSGDAQIYDTIECKGKVYVSSYGQGWIDEIDLKAKKSKPVLTLFKNEEQERIFHLLPAADGKVYGPTMPIKGHLGGGILEWEPENGTHRFYRNVIDQQSVRALTVTSNPDLLFGAGDINGGSGSVPTETSAKIFLWNLKDKKTVWETIPVEGEKIYMGAHRLSGDLVWTVGVYTRTVVVADTAKREIVKTIKLPVSGKGISLRAVGSEPQTLGDRAFVLGGDALFEVDIPTGDVKIVLRSPIIQNKFNPLIHDTMAEYLHPDGTVYLGSGANLYRLRLPNRGH
jgi:outer membrane protein assembly factor BamB